LKLVKAQIAEVETERDLAPTPCVDSETKRLRLLKLRGIGPTVAAVLAREIYYRPFNNRRQVASYIGVAPSPYASGESERCPGISKAGNTFARYIMIEVAWLWLKHQPQSGLSRWYAQRTGGQSGRMRRIMLVAMARKLAVALWRYLEVGLVPDDAVWKEAAAASE
jgi:transposase